MLLLCVPMGRTTRAFLVGAAWAQLAPEAGREGGLPATSALLQNSTSAMELEVLVGMQTDARALGHSLPFLQRQSGTSFLTLLFVSMFGQKDVFYSCGDSVAFCLK